MKMTSMMKTPSKTEDKLKIRTNSTRMELPSCEAIDVRKVNIGNLLVLGMVINAKLTRMSRLVPTSNLVPSLKLLSTIKLISTSMLVICW